MDRRMDEFDVARRALKWMLEHRVYWDGRSDMLLTPATLSGRRPLCQPPDDIAIFILSLAVEVDLEAESAS
jgi:hypothetical protein